MTYITELNQMPLVSSSLFNLFSCDSEKLEAASRALINENKLKAGTHGNFFPEVSKILNKCEQWLQLSCRLK